MIILQTFITVVVIGIYYGGIDRNIIEITVLNFHFESVIHFLVP